MDAHGEKLQPQHKYTRICLVFSLRILGAGGSSFRLASGPNCSQASTLCFCLHRQVVRLGWPSDLLPASPSSSDHGLKHSSPQLEVD